MKFLKLRVSLNDEIKQKNKIKPLLEELIKNHHWELKDFISGYLSNR